MPTTSGSGASRGRHGWTPEDAPALDGRVAIVTGATSGIGYQAALILARRGATTILAARNRDKAEGCVAAIRQLVPNAQASLEVLDLDSLDSVHRFAGAIAERHAVVDILINNAAVMGLPEREETQDGFERQIGVNYLGHFVLTALLLERLCAAPSGGRVVNVASLAHRRGRLELEDFQSERAYSPRGAYARSKLAMLVFALELHRLARRNGWTLHSTAAHPGWARTSIVQNGMGRGEPGLREKLIAFGFGLVAQSAAAGALPLLYAATAPEAVDGFYYGPDRWGETRGTPSLARIFPQAANPEAGRRLWALSERLTGVMFGSALGDRQPG